MNNSEELAFPRIDKIGVASGHVSSHGGMTKREYIAVMAMQAIIPSYMSNPVPINEIDSACANNCQWAIKFADELLRQLETK